MIVATGQTWARFEKEYLHSDCNPDANIWMEDVQWGDLSARTRELAKGPLGNR